MRAVKNIFLIVLTTISFISCEKGVIDEPNVRTAEDVRTDFQNLNLQSGINDVTLESTVSGVFWNFRVIIPADASATNKRPLVMRLHGGASNVSATAHQSTTCMVEPGLEALNAYIISPNSDGFFWFEQQNQVQVLAFLDLAKSYLFIDEGKVVVMGYSDGGNGSWFYADYYSNLFSAAIPMASSYNPIRSDGTVPKINIPLYVIHGENDELFPLNQTQEWVNQSINSGTNIEFVVASGLTHYNSCEYVNYLQDAAVWLQDNVWTN